VDPAEALRRIAFLLERVAIARSIRRVIR